MSPTVRLVARVIGVVIVALVAVPALSFFLVKAEIELHRLLVLYSGFDKANAAVLLAFSQIVVVVCTAWATSVYGKSWHDSVEAAATEAAIHEVSCVRCGGRGDHDCGWPERPCVLCEKRIAADLAAKGAANALANAITRTLPRRKKRG